MPTAFEKKDYSFKIIFFIFLIVLSIGLSIHPLFLNEIHSYLYFIKIIGKLMLVFSSYFIVYYLFKEKLNRKIFVPLFIIMLIIVVSVFSIINNSIEVYPSILVLLILVLMFVLFYNILYKTSSKNIYGEPTTKEKKAITYIINLITLFLVFSMGLELIIKFSPQFIDLKIILRDTGNIVFPWRQTGFLLDANRWALLLLFLISISVFLKKHLNFNNYTFELILYLYLFLTLSKTAFFILIILFFINSRKVLISFSLRKIIYLFILISIFIISIFSLDYEYENSALERRIDFTIESMLNPTETRTLNEREETYIAAIDSIEKNILFGKGYLNFTADTGEQKGISVHNTPLSLMAYYGALLGLLIYFFLFILPLILLFIKFGVNKELISLGIITLIFFNLLSVAHDLILILMYYTTMIVYIITKRK